MARQDSKQQHPESISQALHEINEDLMIDEAQLYAGPKGQLRQWFDEGTVKEADFMIVARDGFDNTLFPVYIDIAKFPDRQTTAETVRGLEAGGDKVMEVYDLHAPREPQIQERRSWQDEQSRESDKAAGVPNNDRPNPATTREEQAERRSVRGTPLNTVAKKSLDIGGPALIQSVPPEILNPAKQGPDREGHGVAEAAANGFVGGVAAGVQGQVLDSAEKGAEAVLDAPLPGLVQPLIADALDTVEKKAPTGSGRPKVVMNPAHLTSLAALDARSEEGLAGSGPDYGH